MQQIVINRCHGGFGLSDAAMIRYWKLCVDSGALKHVYDHEIARDCVHLVKTVRDLGPASNTRYSDLKVVEIPQDVQWTICEYGGVEWVAEAHRTWN